MSIYPVERRMKEESWTLWNLVFNCAVHRMSEAHLKKIAARKIDGDVIGRMEQGSKKRFLKARATMDG